MSEGFWQPADASGPPKYTRTIAWDSVARRGMLYAIDPKGMFTLEIQRCDRNPTEIINVAGDPAADPSTYKCSIVKGNPSMCPDGPLTFWARPPKTYAFNGTDVINGAVCNRFDFSIGMGDQSFWATKTAPCRASHTSERTDYLDFDGTPPAASTFEGPAWLKGLKQCSESTGVSAGTDRAPESFFGGRVHDRYGGLN